MMDEETVIRFFSKVYIPEDDDECWEWLAGNHKDGYGQFFYNGKMFLAHRLSYEFFFGQIPEGLCVRHKKCDNPPCVNPRHLKLGDHQDNMTDRNRKGRQANAMVTESDIVEIRSIYERKELSQYEIAIRFGIGRTQVGRIVNRTHWKTI